MIRDVKLNSNDTSNCKGKHEVARILLSIRQIDVAGQELRLHAFQGYRVISASTIIAGGPTDLLYVEP